MTTYMDDAGHLVADSLGELHDFASVLGLRCDWFQDRRLPHYDLTTCRMRDKAVEHGARIVTSREVVRVARRLRKEQEVYQHDGWHNCDGEIGQYLRYITKPVDDFNGGVPTWAIVVYDQTTVWKYLPIKYCPVCGEVLKLES